MTETKPGVRPAATSDPAAGPTLPFRPDVEGLRAVAVGLVVLFHAGVPGFGGGYLGVDVFFVISGFLITSLMLRELDRTGGVSLLRFYGRRARRVLPAAAVVLTAVILAGYHWLGFLRGDQIAEDGRWAALFAANFRFAGQGADHLAAPMGHFWSLAVGVQFSLLWPAALVLLLWLGFRWALAWFAGAAVAASLAWSLWQAGAAWSFFSPATRGWELGAGCLLAFAAGRLHRIPGRIATAMAGVGLAVIVVAALTFDAATTFPGWAAAVPVLATVLVLAGRGDAVLGRAPLRWLGRLAYPLYLWHLPVLVIAEQAHGGPLPASTRAVLVLVSLALAAATHIGVEDPIRRSGWLRRSPLATTAVALLLITAPLVVAQWRSAGSAAAGIGDGVRHQPRLGAPVAHVRP